MHLCIYNCVSLHCCAGFLWRCVAVSLQWLLLLQTTGSGVCDFIGVGVWAPELGSQALEAPLQ